MRVYRVFSAVVVLLLSFVLTPSVGGQEVTAQTTPSVGVTLPGTFNLNGGDVSLEATSPAVDVDFVSGGVWVTRLNGTVEARSLGGGSVTLPPQSLAVYRGLEGSAVALVPTGDGYWLFTSAGQVISTGTVPFYGDLSTFTLNDPIVAAAPTVSGEGYYMLGADGGVFTFGDARFYGSVQGIVDETIGHGALASDHLTAPIVTLATTPAGYWLVAADGAVFPFGDAPYHGSIQDALNTGNQLAGVTRTWTVTPQVAARAQLARDALVSPIVDIVPAADGAGYLMLASDGGIFNFGQSQFHGSLAGRADYPAVASDVTPSRGGYVVVTADGTIHEFGSFRDLSTGDTGAIVRMARAPWSTGYFQAEVYKLLLEELGYTVTDPAEHELDPEVAFRAMALDYLDFWANGWYPYHNRWLDSELSNGSSVGDHVSPIGQQIVSGGLQGYLIEKNFADKYGIKTLDDLNNNADAIAEYDATDTNPGDGKADFFGCPESWTCDDIMESMIAFSGWDNLAQVKAGYDAMFADAVNRSGEGIPFVIYTWTPSAYITQLIPGSNVYWLGVENVLDDSNPLNLDGGEEWDQRPGIAGLDAQQCPSVSNDPNGLCQLGWEVADILVTARDEFLEQNPVARRLFEVVTFTILDVSLAAVAQDDGAKPKDLAAEWIADNRTTVDGWLTALRVAT